MIPHPRPLRKLGIYAVFPDSHNHCYVVAGQSLPSSGVVGGGNPLAFKRTTPVRAFAGRRNLDSNVT